eukprot:151558-Rhodomonas_salina.3
MVVPTVYLRGSARPQQRKRGHDDSGVVDDDEDEDDDDVGDDQGLKTRGGGSGAWTSRSCGRSTDSLDGDADIRFQTTGFGLRWRRGVEREEEEWGGWTLTREVVTCRLRPEATCRWG